MAGRRTTRSGHGMVLPVSVGVVGLALIGLGQGVLNRQAIEDDLTSRSTGALASAELAGLTVSFSGRDATITGADTTEQAERAETVVADLNGVRVAKAEITEDTAGTETPTGAPTASETSTPEPTPAETSTPEPSPAETSTGSGEPVSLPVGFTLADGTITVTGAVRSTAARTGLIDAVTAAGNGWTVVDRLTIDSSLTGVEPKASRLPAVTRLLARAPIDGTKLVIQYNEGSVILRGTPSDADAERALLTAAAATVAKRSAVVDGLDTPGPT